MDDGGEEMLNVRSLGKEPGPSHATPHRLLEIPGLPGLDVPNLSLANV